MSSVQPEDEVRSTVSRFHQNFSAGRVDLNGHLAHEDVRVTSNTVRLQGRDDFVERLRRYETPFPGLQLADRVIIVEGRTAAVLYALQGVHRGPFAGHEGTGRLIEAWSAEFFDLDEDGLLMDLLTVTRLDHVLDQVRGDMEITGHGPIGRVPVGEVTATTTAAIRRSVARLYSADPATRNDAVSLFAPDAFVMLDEQPLQGGSPWEEHWRRLSAAFPDLSVTVDRTVLEGDRIAVGFTLSGTHDGTLRLGELQLPATGRRMSIQVIDMLAFDESGRVREIISVHNTEEIRAQLTSG